MARKHPWHVCLRGRARETTWEELDSHSDGEAHHIILAYKPHKGSNLPVLPPGADLKIILYVAGVASAWPE